MGRERDNFHALCKDLERTEVKKWLAQILEILMAERAKDQKKTEGDALEGLIKKHEELIPSVMKTQVMVDLYWKCYAYGDELKPHIEFLDGIMLSSTRDIAPSCVENVDELIERQEKSLVQLETKRGVVKDLIDKGKKILENPDKPSDLADANALSAKVHSFEKACLHHLKVLETANAAAQKMTTHKEADNEVAALRERYTKVKAVADEWVAKVDTLVKEWALLDNTVTELNAWVAKDKTSDGENQFSLEKMESTLGELKNIFKQKEK